MARKLRSQQIVVNTLLFTSIGGVAIGLAAGYYRRLDLVLMHFMDGLMAFPAILLGGTPTPRKPRIASASTA